MKHSNLLLVTILLIVSSCKTHENKIVFKERPVQIDGKIEHYKGIYKTGQLVYIDAVTRIIHNEVFEIDSSGNFSVSLKLLHPILGSSYFDLENNFYSFDYIEPDTKYDVTIKKNKIIFNGESGRNNQMITVYYDSLSSNLGATIQKMSLLHTKGLDIVKYIELIKDFEQEKLNYLTEFNKLNPLPANVYNVLKKEIEFKTAHAWINYRFDYSNPGKRELRDSLPADFYSNLYDEYPIVNEVDFQNRNCIDYISNIVSVLSHDDNNIDKKIEFFKTFNFFSSEELEIISKLFSGDKSIRKSKEFKEFYTQENSLKLKELFYRYNFHLLLNNITKLKPNIGRDLVISQSLSRNYFSNNLVPTTNEWNKIDNLIGNKSLNSYLHSYSSQNISTEESHEKATKKVVSDSDEVKKKYIDKYLGKVIYIDFYATWCGPCREEIPYAKVLKHEFTNADVVFLNLCAQSKKNDWEAQIKQKGITGENYLLDNEEYKILANLYDVKGFPTYILIDKKGNVVSKNAPRPSSKQEIINEIKKLNSENK